MADHRPAVPHWTLCQPRQRRSRRENRRDCDAGGAALPSARCRRRAGRQPARHALSGGRMDPAPGGAPCGRQPHECVYPAAQGADRGLAADLTVRREGVGAAGGFVDGAGGTVAGHYRGAARALGANSGVADRGRLAARLQAPADGPDDGGRGDAVVCVALAPPCGAYHAPAQEEGLEVKEKGPEAWIAAQSLLDFAAHDKVWNPIR